MSTRYKIKIGVCVLSCLILIGITQVVQAGTTLRCLIRQPSPDEMDKISSPALEEFEREHPEVKLEVSMFPYLKLRQQIMIKLMAGSPIDVIETTFPQVIEYITKGLIDPVPPYIEENMREIYYPQVLKIGTLKGEHHYGIPCSSGSIAFFYNKTLFAEAGIKEAPKTWDELLTVAQKLTKRDAADKLTQLGLGPFSPPKDIFPYTAWFRSNDAVFWKSKNGKFVETKCTEPNAVEALQWMYDMVYKYKVSHPTYGGGFRAFALGKTAMVGFATWLGYYIVTLKPDLNFATTTMPYNDEKTNRPYSNLFGWWQCVMSESNNKKLAWEFIENQNQAKYDYSQGDFYFISMRKANVQKALRERSEEWKEKMKGVLAGLDFALDWDYYGGFSEFQQANDILGSWLDRCIISNEVTPEEALEGAAAELKWQIE